MFLHGSEIANTNNNEIINLIEFTTESSSIPALQKASIGLLVIMIIIVVILYFVGDRLPLAYIFNINYATLAKFTVLLIIIIGILSVVFSLNTSIVVSYKVNNSIDENNLNSGNELFYGKIAQGQMINMNIRANLNQIANFSTIFQTKENIFINDLMINKLTKKIKLNGQSIQNYQDTFTIPQIFTNDNKWYKVEYLTIKFHSRNAIIIVETQNTILVIENDNIIETYIKVNNRWLYSSYQNQVTHRVFLNIMIQEIIDKYSV